MVMFNVLVSAIWELGFCSRHNALIDMQESVKFGIMQPQAAVGDDLHFNIYHIC